MREEVSQNLQARRDRDRRFTSDWHCSLFLTIYKAQNFALLGCGSLKVYLVPHRCAAAAAIPAPVSAMTSSFTVIRCLLARNPMSVSGVPVASLPVDTWRVLLQHRLDM